MPPEPCPPEPRDRLPGVCFETVAPRPLVTLPRMDVAVFVGFTAQEPPEEVIPDYRPGTPVVVEDAKQFEAAFGGEVELAWDRERGEAVYAHLPRAVRAFFANGGRRCWVVSVGGKDALREFCSRRFLDADLAGVPVASLLTAAEYLRFRSPTPRCTLWGVHAALEVEEATLIAVPDLVHRPVVPRYVPAAAEPVASPVVPMAWPGGFEPCDQPFQTPPAFTAKRHSRRAGHVRLRWRGPPLADAAGVVYVLEEADRPDFAGAAVVYRGAARSVTLYGRGRGEQDCLYYRVRAERGGLRSPWSVPVPVAPRTETPYELEPLALYSDRTLLAVQQALLRLCAARGDLVAVLSLPRHYREEEAREHLRRLRLPLAGTPAPGELSGTLSYGALYHPWLVSAEGAGAYRAVPPDGAAAGVLARRAVERGAWVAPANEPLRGPVALEPAVAPPRYPEWLAARVNLVRQEAQGFFTLTADTLADDAVPELRSISVRRLLILIRLLALRLGSTLVFEPNTEALRRLTERTFEAALDHLFERGAFRPARRSQAYRVVTDASVNPAASVERGRLIVEIQVAPAEPLAFLAVRLVQVGDRDLVVQEV